MKISISFNKKYLCQKSFLVASIVGIIIFILESDLDNLNDVNYLLKHSFSKILFVFLMAIIMYLLHWQYYLKRAEVFCFSFEKDETILEERIVSYAKNWQETYFGKLYKTSHRVVFIAPKRIFTKENYFENSLDDIYIEEKKRTFWGNFFQIISKENKKYRFEVYS